MERWNGGIVETHDNTNGAVIKLSAADSSSIFGSSSTVQPAGLYVQMLIRYAA